MSWQRLKLRALTRRFFPVGPAIAAWALSEPRRLGGRDLARRLLPPSSLTTFVFLAVLMVTVADTHCANAIRSDTKQAR